MRVLANSCISDSPKMTFVIKIDTACARLIRKLHKHYGKYCRRFPVQCKEMQINRDFPLSPLSLTRASSRRSTGTQKKRNHEVALLRSFVIRTGFEPVTHSLEGCCSIQLSYRTDPKVAAKIMINFVIAIKYCVISFGGFISC